MRHESAESHPCKVHKDGASGVPKFPMRHESVESHPCKVRKDGPPDPLPPL